MTATSPKGTAGENLMSSAEEITVSVRKWQQVLQMWEEAKSLRRKAMCYSSPNLGEDHQDSQEQEDPSWRDVVHVGMQGSTNNPDWAGVPFWPVSWQTQGFEQQNHGPIMIDHLHTQSSHLGNDLARVPFSLWPASRFDQQLGIRSHPSPDGSLWSEWSAELPQNGLSKPKKIPQAGKKKETRPEHLPATSPAKVVSTESEMLNDKSKKLSVSDVAGNLDFLIGDVEELSELSVVKDSGFQSEVQEFLDDRDFPWTCLSVVGKRTQQKSESSGISGSDCKILGVVAIRSSDSFLLPDSSDGSLKVSCYIWLHKRDDNLTQRIIAQVIMQVFSTSPVQTNDIRRNHLSLEEVKESTRIEAEIRCFFIEGKKDEDEGGPEQVDFAVLFAEPFRSNVKLTGTSLDFQNYADTVEDIVAKQLAARANTRSNVPKPEIREKLLAGCTDSLCFLIRKAKELANLDMVQKSGFQSQVQEFLKDDDPDFPWTCLAGVRKPDYQTNKSYGISGGCKILGLVAIKSSDGTVTPLRISARIWLLRDEVNVIRRINAQILLQVFGANPMHRNHDVRRNHHTLERVVPTTLIEAEILCLTPCLQQRGKVEKVNLEKAFKEGDLERAQKALRSFHLTLEGQEQDFSKYADLVAKRLKARPEVDKRFKWKTMKDFEGDWLPGNLFKLILSDQLSIDLEKKRGERKELDGHIVVLLPFHDCDGGVVENDQHVLVARMDTRRRAIYLVPRKALHPVGISKDQDTGRETKPHTDKLKELSTYLRSQYQYRVLVKQKDRWRRACLCLNVVGAECMVQLVDDDGKLSEPQPVNADDLKLARALPNIEATLGEGREAATLACSKSQSKKTSQQGGGRSQNAQAQVLMEPEYRKPFVSDTAKIGFLVGEAAELSELSVVKDSGFHSEVQEFLDDRSFRWTCLVGVKDDRNGSSDGSKILGVIVIKSSEDGTSTPFRVSAAIWLRREDDRVSQTIAQIVFQVFGKRAFPPADVRRNQFTVSGLGIEMQVEAHLCCFIKLDKSQEAGELRPEKHIDLKKMRGKDSRSLLEEGFRSLNLKLTGEVQDFSFCAEVVSQMKADWCGGGLATTQGIEEDDALSVGGASATTDTMDALERFSDFARSSSSTSVGGTSATTATTDTWEELWARCGAGVRWGEVAVSDDSGSEEGPPPSRGYRNQNADIVAGVDRPSSPACSVGEASATTATTATTATAEISRAKVNGKKCAHKPENRDKLLSGCTDKITFLIKDAKELSDLNFVKESGFQNDVKKFLNDPDLTWTCLANVRMPDYQKSVSYGISDQDSNILGLVALKSSETSHTPLKICCGIWLQKGDPRVIRRIITQVVLQVFGKKPLFQNHDVRRNHLSLEESGVQKSTPIEAEFRYFSSGTNDDQGAPVIDLKEALKEGGLKELQKTFEISNMKLIGTSLDFTDYADIVAFHLKKRPLNELKVIKEKKGKDKKDKNQKDNEVCKGSWLPGNLFQFNQSGLDLANVEWRRDLDGHIVVLLPWHDRKGSLKLREAEEALVAPVDTKRRAIYLVPRITLHPVGADPQTVERYVRNKYKYKVVVKSGDTWENEPRKAGLCLEVVGGGDGGGTCMVHFDADGEKALPQSVNVSDVRLARDLENILENMGKLGEGEEARTVAESATKSET